MRAAHLVAAPLILLAAASAGAAELKDLAVEVTPPVVALPPAGAAEILVTLRNLGTERLDNLRFSWVCQPAATVSLKAPPPRRLPPHSAAGETLLVTGAGEGPHKGTVYLRIDYTVPDTGGAPRQRILITPFSVEPQEADPVEQVVSIEVKTAAKALVEYRPADLFLLLTNTSNRPINIADISQHAPAFVKVAGLQPPVRADLAPHGVLVVPCQLSLSGEAPHPIQTGKQLLIFQASVSFQKAGRTVQESAVASQEIEVGVLGESEILTALGVPTFLVLPGFLILVTVGLLWRGFKRTGLDLRLDAKSSEFWLLAVSLSIVAALLYPLLTARFGARRNYLEGYGLTDVIAVWAGSILIAAAGFVVFWAGARWVRAWRKGRIPSADDDPLVTLQKLGRLSLSLVRPQADLQDGAQRLRCALLQAPAGRARVWVCPEIRSEGPAAPERAQLTKLLDEDNASALAAALAKMQRDGKLQLSWKPGTITGPLEVDVSSLQLVKKRTILEFAGDAIEE